MTIPPSESKYPVIQCPSCKKQYKLPQLDVDDSKPPTYSCPNCHSVVYQPEEE